MGISTPWGHSDSRKGYGEGITFYGTPSHGGFRVSAERLRAMPADLAAIDPFAGPGWYEEDGDWAVVALAFPECFDPYTLLCAVRTAGYSWVSWREDASRFFMTPRGSGLLLQVARWEKEHAAHWERGSMSSDGRGWLVHYQRMDKSEERTLLLRDYPDEPLPIRPERFEEITRGALQATTPSARERAVVGA